MTQQTENQSEIGPTDSPRNEAGLLERPKSPDLMDRLQNVLSRIQRAQDDQVETLLECDCGDLIRDLRALLAAKDKVIEKSPKTADGVAITELDGPVFAVREHREAVAPHKTKMEVCSCAVVFDHNRIDSWCGWWFGEFGDQAWFALRECYSTRTAAEAAIAAREQAEGGG